jgi:hypothetical protein
MRNGSARKEEAMSPSTRKTKKAAKKAAPKKERTPKEPQVVFAFRLSVAERDLIHKAAGPAKASRFVLGAALAAANADQKGFEALVAQAKANQK